MVDEVDEYEGLTYEQILEHGRLQDAKMEVLQEELERLSKPGSPANRNGADDPISRANADLLEKYEALQEQMARVLSTGSPQPAEPTKPTPRVQLVQEQREQLLAQAAKLREQAINSRCNTGIMVQYAAVMKQIPVIEAELEYLQPPKAQPIAQALNPRAMAEINKAEAKVNAIQTALRGHNPSAQQMVEFSRAQRELREVRAKHLGNAQPRPQR
jgi:hypothetical protein